MALHHYFGASHIPSLEITDFVVLVRMLSVVLHARFDM